MQNNRTAQIVYRTIYITLGFIGIIGSFGYFNRSFNQNFYLMYTNLSNYFCIGITLYLLIGNIRKQDENKISNSISIIRFVSVIMILVTFFVYNILLAKEKTISDYFFSISNLIMHVILPLIYVAFILIRALILGNSYSGTLYPYFFLNVERLGFGGVALWVIILVVIFIALGYILFMFDRFQMIKGKLKKSEK